MTALQDLLYRSTYVTPHDQFVVVGEDEHKLEDGFRRFHWENPHVYETVVRLARHWKQANGAHECGIGLLWEVARWELALSTQGEPLRLNNNYRAFYARMVMEREPDLAGFFRTRRQRA